MNAGPLAIPWVKEHVPAIIEAWWAGEEGGDAMADVIFGNVNPAGRLPLTVYESGEQVPPQDEYDVTKGFTYLYMNSKPLFPFGHGLSYTSFEYSPLKLSSEKITANGHVTVSIDVKNAGDRAGDEVVQLYVHQQISSVKRPAKELRGFKRITLNAGESQTVTLQLPAEKLAFYDVKTHAFFTEPGTYDIWVGTSSEDIRSKTHLEVTAGN